MVGWIPTKIDTYHLLSDQIGPRRTINAAIAMIAYVEELSARINRFNFDDPKYREGYGVPSTEEDYWPESWYDSDDTSAATCNDTSYYGSATDTDSDEGVPAENEKAKETSDENKREVANEN
ncbi:hypothetical protein Y032_0013g2086 [Ancylostoma ceylanicum]|nr:hypothetical protein Y032_0013g2086 [Ancylostoma ceylanicum]